MKGDKFVEGLIDEMYKELSSIKPSAVLVDKSMKYRLTEKNLGYYIPKEEREKRKLHDCFSFFNLEKVDDALNAFFGCSYNLKRVARECVLLDEDDKFTESLDVGKPLGYVYDSKGNVSETSIVELTLKIRAWGDRNPVTNLPFDIIFFRLITDDLGQWKKVEIAREKEIDDSSFQQLSLMDYLVG